MVVSETRSSSCKIASSVNNIFYFFRFVSNNIPLEKASLLEHQTFLTCILGTIYF